MKILITGSKGQLGKELMEYLSNNENVEVISYDRNQMDITNLNHMAEIIESKKPDVIINTAAYTNVDGSETDYNSAYSVNVIGARNIASVADKIGAKLIHISTDFVFDGKKDSLYFEYDSTNPLSVYGKTKLAGEWAVRNSCKKHFIIRTSWLYGKYGNNFVKTMLKLGLEKDSISIVTDQIGSPTLVEDLVKIIDVVMYSESYGVYHFSNSGFCSWNEFAKEIFKIKKYEIEVIDTNSIEYKRPAERPSFSAMDTSMLKSEFNLEIREWKEALFDFLDGNTV